MIEFTKAYKVGIKTFGTLEEAQAFELRVILEPEGGPPSDAKGEYWAQRILENKDRILDVLSTTIDSRPKARAIHGGKKPRKAKIVEPTQGGAQ